MPQAALSLPRPSAKVHAGTRITAALRRAIVIIRLWRDRTRQRRALAALDTRMLRDIGVTPSEARRETEKPFWR